MNSAHNKTKAPVFVGIRQHNRSMTSIPDELRTKALADHPPSSLCLWQLRHEKRQTFKEETPLIQFSEIQPGLFFHNNLEQLHHDFLELGKAPFVNLSGLLKVQALVWPLPQNRHCVVKSWPGEKKIWDLGQVRWSVAN